jgi:proteasome lid subunit RPN8/RPN11
MLTLTQEMHDAIMGHCLDDHPEGACGAVVAGPAGSGRRERVVPMKSAARCWFSESGAAQFSRLRDELDERGEELVVLYCSHAGAPADLLSDGVAGVTEDVHRVVVCVAGSLDDLRSAALKSFSPAGRRVLEEEAEVVAVRAPLRWDEFLMCSQSP